MKKKRRKRRKTSASPESFQSLEDGRIRIKQEKETDGSAVETNFSDDSSELPMNLTSCDRNDTESSAPPAQFLAKEVDSDENQFPLCKKVRQAQQLKLTSSQSSQFVDNSMLEASSAASGSEIIHEMVMPSKIPSKRKQRKDANGAIKKSKHFVKSDSSEAAQGQPESAEFSARRDDLKEEFIIPRERFISICNMDRNALDTYLNANEENSQDLELLQYFGEDKAKSQDFVEEDLGPAHVSVPLLENYQLFSEAKNNDRNSDKISQLRSMLEAHNGNGNVYASSVSSESIIKNLLQKNSEQVCESLPNYNQMSAMGQQQPVRCFEPDMSMKGAVPPSPNTRRKNFSFVPIPNQSTKIKNINQHPAFKSDQMCSPFVSPRATPVNRRANTFLNIRNPTDTKSIPVLGVNNTAFSRPQQFKMEPASAPQSPSMLQNYNYNGGQGQSSHFQFQSLNGQGSNFNFPGESRSQSVPPHCTNTNMFNSYTSYSSACSSVAPTPVPSDYQEFSDSHILDIFTNEQSQPSSIKLEANDDVINLLDNEIMNQSSEESQATRQIYLNSRSVPNTPLPYHTNYGNMNSFCPVGKSVPTTPVETNGNPFRYSPGLQRTRDFLISGFNNNNNNSVINNNTAKLMEDKGDGFRGEESIGNDMDDLSNLDTSLLNNL